MSNPVNLDKQKLIFGKLFLLSNKLQVIGDCVLNSENKTELGVTIRQWLLTAAILQFGDNYPALSKVADLMGTSRQNIKQLARNLEIKGLISFEKDKRDQRAVRLKVTDKSFTYWLNQQEKVGKFLNVLFEDLSKEETEMLHDGLKKFYEGIAVERLIEKQSTNVDTAAGATVTSKAYLKAVENALQKK